MEGMGKKLFLLTAIAPPPHRIRTVPKFSRRTGQALPRRHRSRIHAREDGNGESADTAPTFYVPIASNDNRPHETTEKHERLL